MNDVLIRICVGACGLLVAVVSGGVVIDDWIDRETRFMAVFGILVGVGAMLHAVGVW